MSLRTIGFVRASGPGSASRGGFSLVEVLVAAICVVIISQGIYSFLRASQQGTRQGMEVSEQLKSAVILSRYLEMDMAGVLLGAATSTIGTVGRSPEISINGREEEYLFSSLHRGTLQNIRYRFDPVNMEVTRVLETNGQALQTTSFGKGMMEGFSLMPIGSTGSLFRLRVHVRGQVYNSKFERVFASGYAGCASEARHWVFSVKNE